MHKVHTFCRVCEPSCGLVAEVDGEKIISLKPDRDHPVSAGYACHKGLATLEIHNDPDRLSHPLVRRGKDFEQCSWTEAAVGISSALKNIQDQYGKESVASYTGNPLAFNTLAGPAISSFLIKNEIRKNFSSGTQDCTNKFAGSEAMFGSSTIHPIPDIHNTDFLLLFGTNPRISNMSFVSIADPMNALREAKKRGVDIRFVDPRINDSVKGIGEIVHVNPDTDVYLMAAMLHHLDRSQRFDEAFLKEHGDNVDALRAFIAQYSPARVAGVVGISAQEIEALANDFASASSAAVHMSTGVNMGRQGTLAYWLLFMLSMVTGNFDKVGGNLYSLGFYAAAKAGKSGREDPYFDSPFGQMRKIRGALPGNMMADMMLAEENPIKAMVVISGNPLISVGDSERLKKAFSSLELLIVIDIYHNATAELAHYVLPATGMYEREDINLCGLGMQDRPFVQYTNYIVPPQLERKPEWWILGRLEQASGFDSIFDDKGLDDKELDSKESIVKGSDLFGRTDHMLRQSHLSIEALKEMPSNTAVLPGIQSGTFFTDWIQTESQRVDCCPSLLSESRIECERLFLESNANIEADAVQLKMITRRTNYMVNSWFHNVKSLKRKAQLSNPLFMHPEDARARNLGEGSRVQIKNNNGAIVSTVALDEGLKLGTVALTHGWGNDETRMETAKKFAGVNANILLPSGPGSYEKISNQAFMTGIPVDVEVYS
ncbi:MAG: molybdopterin-dependent oxidoreductase [Pseudomonadales bacterium]|nr:molybdopterin-dependent oxidoreductase [Pseudomonadales bacterium]